MAEIFNNVQAVEAGILKGASCAFGVFDGVHAGHRFLVDSACESARELGSKSIAITFDIDPDEMFDPLGLKKLMSNQDRIAALAQTGVDCVLVLPFTREFASLSPVEFLQRTFGDSAPAVLHVGNDFRFGSRAQGDVMVLREWGDCHGMAVVGHELLNAEGGPVTATRIRTLLGQGDVKSAAQLLTHPYTLHDNVIAGRGQGRDMGFRTANLYVEPGRRVLREGVYAAYAIVDGRKYKAAVSIGVSPTFKEEAKAYSEVHILDFAEDIYDQDIFVQFVEWLRPMIEFESTEELIQTVMGNIAWVRDNL